MFINETKINIFMVGDSVICSTPAFDLLQHFFGLIIAYMWRVFELFYVPRNLLCVWKSHALVRSYIARLGTWRECVRVCDVNRWLSGWFGVVVGFVGRWYLHFVHLIRQHMDGDSIVGGKGFRQCWILSCHWGMLQSMG